MFEISNMSNLRSVLRKASNIKALINIKAINTVLIMIKAILNAVIAFLNHDDLYYDIFDNFMIKSCTSESI